MVKYNVAPFALLVDLAHFKIALASACNTYQWVFSFSSSQQLSNPEGVPLYPSEIIISSLTINAPTCLRLQCESCAHVLAMRKYALSYRSCFAVFMCLQIVSTKIGLILD